MKAWDCGPFPPILRETGGTFTNWVFWGDEDYAFLVEVPELPGCMADGNSYQEALANAKQTTQEWIETAEQLGRSIPQPKGRLTYA
jgi:predicted RNase H-like HicB family nuclease